MTTIVLPEHASDEALQPRALILTVAGLYIRRSGDWMSVSQIIRLLEPLDVDSQAVRAAISRLKKRDVFVAEKRDGVPGYALSDYARSLLAIGESRVLDPPQGSEDAWVLAVFSVPNSDREKRHMLRTRLAWLGFGNVSSGVWIAPAHIASDAKTILAQDGFAPYLDLFRATHLGFEDVSKRVAEWWDLDTLDTLHRAFVDEQEPVREKWAERGPEGTDDREAYRDYVLALTRWRRLPYLDPCLPWNLLPPAWSGRAASELFNDLRARLEGPADRFAASTAPPINHHKSRHDDRSRALSD